MNVVSSNTPTGPLRVVMVNPKAQKVHQRLPLSLLFLSRAIPDDVPWILVDANVEPAAKGKAEAFIRIAPERTLVLVTVMPGPQLQWAVPWCRELKRRWPDITLVWGGYFPTVHTQTTLQENTVDMVAVGPGEATLAELIERLQKGNAPDGIPGLVTKRDGELVHGPPRRRQRSADFGPIPYHRIPTYDYAAPTFLGSRTYNHHTSMGCPYKCNFCAVVNMFDGSWLADSADSVIHTVRHLHEKYDANAIEFHDNNFFASERRTAAVANGIRDLNLNWWGEARIDTLLRWKTSTWRSVSESGLKMVFLGAESGSQTALNAMNKGGLQVHEISEINRVAKAHGIIPEFSFVLGGTDEPETEIAESLELVRRLKQENGAAEIILYLYTPVPLPGVYENAKRLGFSLPNNFDEWLGPPWNHYAERRTASTPWMEKRYVKQIYDFESVLHAMWPSSSDTRLSQSQKKVLRQLAHPRWTTQLTANPLFIQSLQRLWKYRRPEEAGF